MKSPRAKFGRALLVLLAGAVAAGGGCRKKAIEGPGEERAPAGPAAPAKAADVSGTISLPGGKPLPAGWIAFHGADAAEAVLAPIDGGKFLARGAPVGDAVRVTVNVTDVAAEADFLDARLREAHVRAGLMKGSGKLGADLEKRIEEMKDRRKKLGELAKSVEGVKVAPRCTQRETTPLRYKIASGTQAIEITLPAP